MSTQASFGEKQHTKTTANGDGSAEPPDVTIARDLIRLGVPIFVANRADEFPHGGTGGKLGYWLPPGWEQTKPDESVLDDWRPGDALGAVMGGVFDVLDTDPRNGGDDSFDALLHELAGDLPNSYGYVSTPSGGWHDWIAALGIGKHTDFWKNAGRKGLDLQGGRPDGTSVGFVFIPPTERRSKVDGKVRAYQWDELPEAPEPDDKSGEALARLIVDSAGRGQRNNTGSKSAASDRTQKMLTQRELQHYVRHGIPEDEAQDDTLTRCVWAWRVRNARKEWAYQRWETIVSKTTLKDPAWPFTRNDFDSKWKSADAKRSAEEAAEREARRLRDDDAGADEDDLEAEVAERVRALLIEQMSRARLATRGWTDPGALDSTELDVQYPDWLIQDFIEDGTVGNLTGAFGTAKSFMAIDWACCVATGKDWFGQKVRKANVIYVAAEGQKGIGRRIRAWEKARKTKIEKSALTVVIKPVQLASEAAVGWLERQIIDSEADFLIIDTLARSIDGLNDSDTADMGLVITALYKIRDARGENMTTSLVVAHTGWENKERSRGSSRLPSDSDFVFNMRKDEKTGVFTLKCTKFKEDQEPLPRYFTLGVFQVLPPCGDHGPVTSCVLQKATVEEEEAAPAKVNPDEQLLSHLREHTQGSTVAEMEDALHRNYKNLSTAVNKLERAGRTRSEKMPHGNAKIWFAV